MHPDAGKFIELAIRPLADNAELKLAAGAALAKALEAHPAIPLEQATAALERADARPHRRKWWIGLYLVTLLVSAPLLIHTAGQAIKTRGIPTLAATPTPQRIPDLTPSQKRLLSGDEQAVTAADRWKPLWQSDPENAAYLAEYAAAYFKDRKQLSPEILAAAERVDPENGWFVALSAAGTVEGAVTRGKRSKKDIADGKAAVLTITDGKRLEESLALLHRLAGMPRFTDHQIALFKQRIPLFPPRRDFVSQIPLLAQAAGITTSSIHFRRFPDALAAGAQQCAEKGDIVGFRRIVADWHALAVMTASNGGTLVDLLVAKVMMSGPAENFRDSARRLGLTEEAAYFEHLAARFTAEKKQREDNRRGGDADRDFNRKSSLLAGLTGPLLSRQVVSPPPITEADLLPGRRVDHALFGRMGSAAAWMLSGLTLAAAALGLRVQRPLTRRLSARMLDLLHRPDWLWLFLGGVVFPVGWYLWISRLSPFAAREWSVTWFSFIPLLGQFGAFLVSLIVLPMVIAGRLLAKRGTALGLAPRACWPGWLAAAGAMVAVPAFGAVPRDETAWGPFLVFATASEGVAVAWILVGLLLGLFGPRSQVLRRATMSRMMLPVLASVMLVMALLIPFHYAEEKHWVQQDHFGEISTDFPSMSRYEYQVTQILRREVLELLGDLPENR